MKISLMKETQQNDMPMEVTPSGLGSGDGCYPCAYVDDLPMVEGVKAGDIVTITGLVEEVMHSDSTEKDPRTNLRVRLKELETTGKTGGKGKKKSDDQEFEETMKEVETSKKDDSEDTYEEDEE